MKKTVLALSISVAIVGLGAFGSAQAISPVVPGTATSLGTYANNSGNILLVPYYSANQDNKTQINIVNTDTVNGKAVKVRFRSAANSDDVFDFQLLMSPGDVWSGEVSRDATTGLAKLATGDTTCAKPAIKGALAANLLFKTGRLDTVKGTADSMAAATREGYVEILNMADIAPASALYTATKHGDGGTAPACSGAAFTALDTNIVGVIGVPTAAETTTTLSAAAQATAKGLANPTGKLIANWTLLNTTTSSIYGGAAKGVAGFIGAAAGTGNLTYWPQSTVTGIPSLADVTGQTADPLLITAAPIVAPTNVDLPDLSTPVVSVDVTTGVAADPAGAALRLSALLATPSVVNEYLTDSSIHASTDWTFSMPTRRYAVAYNYGTGTAAFNALVNTYFTAANATANATRRMVCVNNVLPVGYGREEELVASVVFSPSIAPTLCGEVSVLSFNNAASSTSNSLLATATLNDIDASYTSGWMTIQTPGLASAGLPTIGHSYVRAYTGTLNIGVAYPHR